MESTQGMKWTIGVVDGNVVLQIAAPENDKSWIMINMHPTDARRVASSILEVCDHVAPPVIN
jgi:hypothetical protein